MFSSSYLAFTLRINSGEHEEARTRVLAMLQYTIRRILYMIPTLFVVSIISFAIIQLPPGDYLTSVVTAMTATGETIDASALAAMEQRYGLGQPIYVQIGSGYRASCCVAILANPLSGTNRSTS